MARCPRAPAAGGFPRGYGTPCDSPVPAAARRRAAGCPCRHLGQPDAPASRAHKTPAPPRPGLAGGNVGLAAGRGGRDGPPVPAGPGMRVVQIERWALGADLRDPGEVVPGRAGGRPLQRVREPPRVRRRGPSARTSRSCTRCVAARPGHCPGRAARARLHRSRPGRCKTWETAPPGAWWCDVRGATGSRGRTTRHRRSTVPSRSGHFRSSAPPQLPVLSPSVHPAVAPVR